MVVLVAKICYSERVPSTASVRTAPRAERQEARHALPRPLPTVTLVLLIPPVLSRNNTCERSSRDALLETHTRDFDVGAGHVGTSACTHIPDHYVVCTNSPGTVSLPYQVRNVGIQIMFPEVSPAGSQKDAVVGLLH